MQVGQGSPGISLEYLMQQAQAGKMFHGGVDLAASAGVYPHVQLLNPAGSGKTAVVVAFTGGCGNNGGWRYCDLDTALATPTTALGNVKTGSAAPACTVNSETNASQLGTLVVPYKANTGITLVSPYGWFAVLDAGQGVLIGHDVVNTRVQVNYAWLEL